MKMVAAAKLRRAQEVAERARPYTEKLTEMFGAIAAGVEPEAHPLLARRPERRVDLLVLTSDRGLCGGYNTNLLRLAAAFARERAAEIALSVVGRKGVEYYRRRGGRILVYELVMLSTRATAPASVPAPALTRRALDD